MREREAVIHTVFCSTRSLPERVLLNLSAGIVWTSGKGGERIHNTSWLTTPPPPPPQLTIQDHESPLPLLKKVHHLGGGGRGEGGGSSQVDKYTPWQPGSKFYCTGVGTCTGTTCTGVATNLLRVPRSLLCIGHHGVGTDGHSSVG